MRVPYLDDDCIFHKANDFLCQHYPSFECPVPVEIIIGKELGVYVFPVKDLEKCCDVHGGVGKDFKSILIDEKQYMNQEGRSRFTIAHELGHIILHSQLFDEISQLNTDQNYIDFQNHITFDEHKKLEIQANLFAEEIIFPKEVLREVVENMVSKLGGADKLLPSDLASIIDYVQKKFGVTRDCAYNKLRRNYSELFNMVFTNSPF